MKNFTLGGWGIKPRIFHKKSGTPIIHHFFTAGDGGGSGGCVKIFILFFEDFPNQNVKKQMTSENT